MHCRISLLSIFLISCSGFFLFILGDFFFFFSSFEKIAQMISLHLKCVFKTFIAVVTVEVKNEAAHCGLLCKTGITVSSSLSWIQGLELLVVTFLAGLRCWLEVSLFVLVHNESHGDPESASRLSLLQGGY